MTAVVQHVFKVFKTGERVRFRLGAHDVAGTVVEDLGNIGARREQILRVEVVLDPTSVQQFELPASLLAPEQAPVKLL